MKKIDFKVLFKLLGGLAIWGLAYSQLLSVASFLTNLLPLGAESKAAESARFFLYDAPKVLMLLMLVIFIMGVVRSFFSPVNTRKLLAGRRRGFGNILASLLGVVTPFCSCSAVPLFIAFLGAGIPLGVTFSFLIAAPLVNEIALGLLWALVGWKVALLYLVLGLLVAVIAGYVLGQMGLEKWLEGWVRDMQAGPDKASSVATLSLEQRMSEGLKSVKEIVGKVWIWILIGVGVGAAIHGYAPEDMLESLLGAQQWWSVPLAVLIGIPLYANHAAILPVASALLGKGVSVGTVLAFMMSVTALSAPEMIILRRVLKKKLIALFIAVVAVGILMAGFIFNWLL